MKINCIDSLFSADEVNQVVQLGDSLIHTEGLIKNDKLDHKVRNAKIAWIHPSEASWWLFNKALEVFADSLPFGALQSMQYTVYHTGGHYDWHKDVGNGDKIMKARVEAAVLQLSEPSDYEGGILEIKDRAKILAIPKQQGMVATFPVEAWHRVTPTTSGVRKTLILWSLK